MDNLPRLMTYLWPFRRQLLVSIVLGLMIAGLWGANLSFAFPVIKVLLDRKNLHDYVAESIEEAHRKVLSEEKAVRIHTDRVNEMQAEGVSPVASDFTEALRDRAHADAKLASARTEHWEFMWLQSNVMPFVPRNEFHTLFWLLMIVLVATAVKGFLIFLQEVLVGRTAELTVMSIRKDLFRRVLNMDYQYLSHEGTSGLMSRFTYDCEQLAQGIVLIGGRMIREPLKCLTCMLLAMYLNWRLTSLSLVFLPLLALFLGKFGTMLKRASQRMMESMSQIYKVLEESFSGLKAVIAFHNQQHHEDQFARQYESYYRKAMKLVRIDAAAKPLLEFIGLTAMFLAVFPGTYLVLRGKEHIMGVRLTAKVMSPADLLTLYLLLVGMLDPCRKLSTTFSKLKRSSAALDRIIGLIDRESRIVDPSIPRPVLRHHTSIRFEDVSFRYASRDPNGQRGLALEHLDLEIPFGECVAIVGTNGCGKSTLVNLLPRFYDPDDGRVLIDDIPLPEMALADLRRQLGIVTQETMLFDETIFENIRYGTPEATKAEVEQAARQAHVLEIIQSLPQGFETKIGDKGKELSGGQRQRIAFARAILRDPSILILDEATSAADAESESLIHETLKTFVKGRTTLLISHTLSNSLLEFITRIVVLDKGSVIATGTHEQLVETCPVYQRLFNSPARVMSRAA